MIKNSNKADKRADELIEHWYTLVPGHQFSPAEFYESVEGDIACQKFPTLIASRIDLPEGGVLSDNRVYLRMRRERLTFDVCAAPVGVNFFFSYRFYVDTPRFGVQEAVLAILVLLGIYWGLSSLLGFLIGAFSLFFLCLAFWGTLVSVAAKGFGNLDSFFSDLVVVGPLYERFFRKDTYYRQDLRIAYCSIVSSIVKEKVENLISAKGIELVREFERSPGFAEIYDMKERAVGAAV